MSNNNRFLTKILNKADLAQFTGSEN